MAVIPSIDRPRVVFDCNIYLQAAVRSTGPAFACLELAEAQDIAALTSAEILSEVSSVLSRPNIRRKFTVLTDDYIAAFMERLMQIVEMVPEVSNVFSFLRDPKDEPYLNLAIAGRANYLVSRDKDLLDLRDGSDEESEAFRDKCPHILIVDPVEFLRATRASEQSSQFTAIWRKGL